MTTDKSPKVFVFHDLHPEDGAMLQALYSRSPASVVDHLEKVKKSGSGKFMEQFYVGYGHASIGDCGFTTIFIENVSQLVAKAIQDNPLYNGQEASTRYLDFSAQPLVDPFITEESKAILQGWMNIYNTYMPKVRDALKREYPFNPEDYKSEKQWEGAIAARAFDTLRAFLPVGSTTLLSWTTNLRQARDRLMRLKSHPLAEVRDIAHVIFKQLAEKYSHSFNGGEMDDDSRYAPRHQYYGDAGEDFYMTFERWVRGLSVPEEHAVRHGEFVCRKQQIDIDGLNRYETAALRSRPEGALLPRRLSMYGHYNCYFKMDFASYRDLQRHRGGYCLIPLITGLYGMNQWYMDELRRLLPQDYRNIETTTQDLLARIQKIVLRKGEEQAQYLYPMGVDVPVLLSYSLPQMVYVAELRSNKTVHPSLRPIAQQMARVLQQAHPELKLYVDWDQDSWSAKRGDQNIAAKPPTEPELPLKAAVQ